MLTGWCSDCADIHSPDRRQAILERLDNATPAEVYERLGNKAVHIWGERDKTRTLSRDLLAVRNRNGWDNHQPKKFTQDEIDLIFKLHALGYFATRIAARIGRTRDSITSFLTYRKHHRRKKKQ